MSSDLSERARLLWAGLGRADFPEAGVSVVVSPDSGLCPPGWCGAVTLGDGTLVTAPTDRAAQRLRAVPVADLARHPEATEVIGPAHLAYLDRAEFRPIGQPAVHLPHDDPALVALRARATAPEADETDLANLSFAVLAPDGRALAAAGYHVWPGGAAQLNVFADPGERNRGHARSAAAAAVAHALAADLLPQWRARPAASRRVAAGLGFRELGVQYCLRLPTE
ncbi:GNAT family N-acetyltransferase [Streptomyces tateyamensis]|uniref:GNAT family N-acetyltransferase n=1 Tax=Streptomyces tateyamensis TaxID=565073 RepID=A0A2V4P6V3_9ACTN|nr:GNAT family N-acetyltransferase [Streptomyces tateyamensis]PYC78852.1 GNAT family N-acetyltransferase [Streptomyces tateyamensis]